MTEQAKARRRVIREGPVGPFEVAVRWGGVLAYLAFAAFSAWTFLAYVKPDGPMAQGILDPRVYPNSVLVQFTLGEYFESFGPWRGLSAMPWKAWGWWAVIVVILGVSSRDAIRSGPLHLFPGVALWIPFALVAGLVGCLQDSLLGSSALLAVLAVLILGVPVAALIRDGFTRRQALSRRRRRDLAMRLCSARGIAWAFITLLLAIAFLAASTPEVNRDPLRYHLAAPQVWLERGERTAIEGMAFSHFPFLVEGWFLLGLWLQGDVLARLFHFMFLLASLGLVASFTWRLAKWAGLPSKPWRALPTLAVALAATIPALTITSTWANIDAGIVCFHVGMTLAFALWWHTGRISHLIIAAILAGFALGTKYTAAVPVFVLGLGVLLHKRHALTGRVIPRLDRIKGAFLFAIISGVLGGVWYSSNFREVGNPLYPLANGMFEAPGWPPESQAFWEAKAAEKGVGFEWSKLGAAWRGATFRWAGGEGVGPGGFEEQSIGFAPWLLAPLGLAGLFLIAIRRGGWWWFYLAFIAVNFALWFATYQSNRLLLSTLLIALPGCVVGLAYIAQWWRPLWIAATVSLGVACAYQGLWIARYLLVEQCAPQLALGFWSDEEWLSAKLNYYDATNAIRRDVPEDEKVLVIGESRRFHFPPNVVMSDWFDPPVFLHFLDGSDTSADVSAALRAEGVTHILINFPELLPRAWWPTAFGSGMLLHDDGTIDSARWWRAFVDGADLPAGSNLAFLRERLSDTESHLLSTWLSSVPHEIIWHGDQPHTLGVELWELSDTAAPE